MQKKKKAQEKNHSRQASRREGRLATLEPFFERLMEQFHSAHWLASDPIQHVHRFTDPKDQEIVAFIAACFAYGKVTFVHRAITAVVTPMGPNPAAFVKSYDGKNHWSGFYHRFHHEGHVVVLIALLKTLLEQYGSIGEMFRANIETGDEPLCERVLNGAAGWFRSQANIQLAKQNDPGLTRGMKFFFNAPSDGSACKRMVMFLRWMVRKDEIDLGLWDWFDPKDLVVPADTHVARISYYLRLRQGKENAPPNWRMAREVTQSLSVLHEKDPVRYDFAMTRLGILDICKRKYTKSVCTRCPIEPGCRFSNLKAAS